MSSDHKFDIIVIGAGSAGIGVAGFMNKAGFDVLFIDKSDENIGGDCLNYGCVPSKSLIHMARTVHHARMAENVGLDIKGLPDMQKVIAYVHEKQNIIRKHENAAYFRKEGMTVVLGKAQFSGKNKVKVNGTQYTGKKIVIATGSRPRKLKVPGIDKVEYFDNEHIFNISSLPKQLLVVGGGPIGMELGQAFQYLGSQVTVVHSKSAILNKEHPKISQVLYNKLKENGITFHLNAKVISFDSSHKAIAEQNGRKFEIDFDTVLVGIGRDLNIHDLGLEKAGIKMDGHKIRINEYLQTSNKDVFVCGDAAGMHKFSHAAEMHARLLISNFFTPWRKKLDTSHLSWVTFTDPEVATFGMQEDQLSKSGKDFETLEVDFSDDDRAIINEYRYGKLLLYISKGFLGKGKKILGGTMVSPNAGEMVQELILANSNGISINKIFEKIYPYPTASRVNQKIILEYNIKKLTPFMKKILKQLYKLK